MPDAATYRKSVNRAQLLLSVVLEELDIDLSPLDVRVLLTAAADIVWDSMLSAVGENPDDFPF